MISTTCDGRWPAIGDGDEEDDADLGEDADGGHACSKRGAVGHGEEREGKDPKGRE